MKKIIDYPRIGIIELLTKRNCNGIRYIVSEKYVRIYTAPSLLKSVFPLSEERIQWILNNKEKIEKKTKQSFLYNLDTELDTFSFKLKFAVEPKLVNQFSAKLQEKILTIFVPPETDFQDIKNQLFIKKILKYFLTKEAKRILPDKLHFFAEKYGFSFNEVKITAAKTRWGSCNAKKNIALSCFLLFLPEDIIDMVLLHELCHTEQMNHAEKFYVRLRRILPNLAELDKKIKIEEKKIKSFY
jgi:predicted metal-dependent hydrolase